MNHAHFSLPRLLAIVLAAAFLGAGQAHAKRIPKLYTFGPVNSEVGPIKKEALAKLPREEQIQLEALGADTVGFNYKHLGLFWLDIWSWGGEYSVYNKLNDIPYKITKPQAAAFLGIEESKLTVPLSYHIPWGLVVIVGLALLKIVPRLILKNRQARQSAKFNSAPQWSPQPPGPSSPPPPPPAGYGPPPVPPPLPPDQQ